jgi:hypothetical protein
MVKPTSSPVSASRGTLPAGTVLTGGMGGAEGFASVVSGALRGRSLDPLGPAESFDDDGASGMLSSSTPGAPGRGLGGSGGGMGRVAEGASGMSSGFCCADSVGTSAPANNNDSPSLNSVLFFVAIPKPRSFIPKPCLLSLSVLPGPSDPHARRLFVNSDAQPRLFGASNPYSGLQDRLAKSRDNNVHA